MPDENRCERIGDVHRAHALIVPGDVDEARRALVEPGQMRGGAGAATGTVAIADELLALLIEIIRHVVEPEGREQHYIGRPLALDHFRVLEIGDIENTTKARRAI